MRRLTGGRCDSSPSRWPGLAIIAGGSLMLALWPVFTSLHGPTSVNEEGTLLGLSALFWGSMMEGPSLLLIALGLAGSYVRLTGQAGRAACVGFVLVMVALVVPALINIAIRAVIPPLLAPVLGAGLVLMAVGNRASSLTTFSRAVLVSLGILQLFALLWALLVRPDVLDQIDGYRIYGVGANVLVGLGWILLGASFLTRRGRVRASEPVAARA